MKEEQVYLDNKESFYKIGKIFYILNNIDISLITFLSMFFADNLDRHDEKNYIFNRSLFNEKIFPTIENRRQLALEVIRSVKRVSVEKRIYFDNLKYEKIIKKIQKAQEERNTLAHNKILFINNEIGYSIPKSHTERLLPDNKGTYKFAKIDLDIMVQDFEKVEKDSSSLLEIILFVSNILNKK